MKTVTLTFQIKKLLNIMLKKDKEALYQLVDNEIMRIAQEP